MTVALILVGVGALLTILTYVAFGARRWELLLVMLLLVVSLFVVLAVSGPREESTWRMIAYAGSGLVTGYIIHRIKAADQHRREVAAAELEAGAPKGLARLFSRSHSTS